MAGATPTRAAGRAGRVGASPHVRPLLVIASAFAASRAAAYVAGVRFNADTIGQFWQIVDPELLTDRLGESLFYLHSQPPLFNLYLGVLLKAFPAHHGSFAQASYIVLGVVGAVALYGFLVRMSCGRWTSVAVTVLLTVAPPAILYENLLFYEYPAAVLLVLSGFALAVFIGRKSFWPGFAFFSLLASVIWLRTSFQIVWMLAAVALVLIALRERKRVVIGACLVPLVLVLVLYAKNIALFGVPSTSSWFGMNFARMVFKAIPTSERIERVQRGALSRVSLVEPFSAVEAYRGHAPLSRATGVPVLDQRRLPGGPPNFNNKSYLRISGRYLRDSIRLVRDEPIAYLQEVARSFKGSFLPSEDYRSALGNRAKIRRYTQAFNHAVYLQTPYGGRIGLGILGAYALALAYGCRLAHRWIRGGARSDPVLVTLLYAWVTVAYLVLLLAFTSGYENHRIRFAVDPLAAVLAVCALREAWLLIRRRGRARQPEPM